MKRKFDLLAIVFVMVVTLSSCAITQRGMKEDNTYYSNQHPSVQIKLGENFEYRKGESEQFQHQFFDLENHRQAFIHVHLHDANQTQIDYYHDPEQWIYHLPPDSVELNRFSKKFVGEKWYIQDAVYHPSTASCLLLRDLSVFTDTNDIFKMRYSWEIPPYNCGQWKTVNSLSASQEKFIKEFLEGFADDVTISKYIEEGDFAQFKVTESQNEIPAANLYPKKSGPQKSTVVSATASPKKTKKVVIFPWILQGEAETFLTILSNSIRYYVGESDDLELEKSYYKIKKVAKLNVPGYDAFYNSNTPNLELVKKIAAEEGAQLAVLGYMNIHCRWSDACQVRQMETVLVDIETGDVKRVDGASWTLDARDVVESTIKELFSGYITEI